MSKIISNLLPIYLLISIANCFPDQGKWDFEMNSVSTQLSVKTNLSLLYTVTTRETT